MQNGAATYEKRVAVDVVVDPSASTGVTSTSIELDELEEVRGGVKHVPLTLAGTLDKTRPSLSLRKRQATNGTVVSMVRPSSSVPPDTVPKVGKMCTGVGGTKYSNDSRFGSSGPPCTASCREVFCAPETEGVRQATSPVSKLLAGTRAFPNMHDKGKGLGLVAATWYRIFTSSPPWIDPARGWTSWMSK